MQGLEGACPSFQAWHCSPLAGAAPPLTARVGEASHLDTHRAHDPVADCGKGTRGGMCTVGGCPASATPLSRCHATASPQPFTLTGGEAQSDGGAANSQQPGGHRVLGGHFAVAPDLRTGGGQANQMRGRQTCGGAHSSQTVTKRLCILPQRLRVLGLADTCSRCPGPN